MLQIIKDAIFTSALMIVISIIITTIIIGETHHLFDASDETPLAWGAIAVSFITSVAITSMYHKLVIDPRSKTA